MISNKFLKKKYLFLLLFIIFIGTVLRLYHLGKQSLWLDEAYSVMMSRSLITPWFEQVQDSSPPLYYSLLHYWINMFGKSEFSLRLLSCIFGILLIPLVFIVGTSVFNRKVGIYAALFTAISPIHIYYSQEARMYALLPFLSLVSFFMLSLSLRKNKNIYWITYILTTIFCLYTHNHGVFLLVAEMCFYIFYNRKKSRGLLLKFILSQLTILGAFLPRIFVLSQQIFMEMNPWIALTTLRDIYSTFLHFCLLSYHLPLTESISITLKIAIPIFALIFLVGIFVSQKQNTFLPVYIIIPLAIAFVISCKLPIYVAGRYDILVFPAFCLIIALGLSKITPRLFRLSLLTIIILSTLISLYHYYFIYNKSNDRIISEYVQKYINREDVVVITELNITPFEYYWSRDFQPNLFQFPEGPRYSLKKEVFEFEFYWMQQFWPNISCIQKTALLKKPLKENSQKVKTGSYIIDI